MVVLWISEVSEDFSPVMFSLLKYYLHLDSPFFLCTRTKLKREYVAIAFSYSCDYVFKEGLILFISTIIL